MTVILIELLRDTIKRLMPTKIVNTVSQIFVSASSLAASLRLFTLSHSQTRRLADLHFRAELCPRCDVEDILRLVHIYDRYYVLLPTLPFFLFETAQLP